jgi:hypothetical protein
VAVSQSKIIGRGIFDLENNIFCDSCERNPASEFSPKKFRCNRCNDIITIEDLREGRAMAVEEKAYCGTCKRTMAAQPPEPAAVPPPTPPSAPSPPAATVRPRASGRSVPRSGTPAKSPTRGTGEVRCDLCSKSFKLSDLRSGSAQIKDGKVLCPRCMHRLAKRNRKYDTKFVLSLVFIVVVFPLVSAGLIVTLFLFIIDSPKDKAPEKTPDVTSPEVRQKGNPSLLDRPGGTPSTSPALPSGAPETGIDLSQGDIAQIMRTLREADGDDAPVSPTRPKPKLAPVSPPKVDAKGGDNLAAALSHPNPAVRMEAIFLAAVAQKTEAVPHLIRCLEDEDPFLRAFAASALGKLKARKAAAAILKRIHDPQATVRQAAARALVSILNIRFRHANDFSRDEMDNFIRYLEWLKKKGEKKGD